MRRGQTSWKAFGLIPPIRSCCGVLHPMGTILIRFVGLLFLAVVVLALAWR
jgi:hypothetical protein